MKTKNFNLLSFEDFIAEKYTPMVENQCQMKDYVKIIDDANGMIPSEAVGKTGQITGLFGGNYLVQFESPIQTMSDDVLQNVEVPCSSVMKLNEAMSTKDMPSDLVDLINTKKVPVLIGKSLEKVFEFVRLFNQQNRMNFKVKSWDFEKNSVSLQMDNDGNYSLCIDNSGAIYFYCGSKKEDKVSNYSDFEDGMEKFKLYIGN